jgi:Trypsin-co-occurring domain 2
MVRLGPYVAQVASAAPAGPAPPPAGPLTPPFGMARMRQEVGMAEEPLIGLGEALGSLRRELAAAIEEWEGEALRFRLGPVEVEFTMGVTREVGAEGGVKWWVISFGAKGSRETMATQRVKLSLTPVAAAGEEVLAPE